MISLSNSILTLLFQMNKRYIGIVLPFLMLLLFFNNRCLHYHVGSFTSGKVISSIENSVQPTSPASQSLNKDKQDNSKYRIRIKAWDDNYWFIPNAHYDINYISILFCDFTVNTSHFYYKAYCLCKNGLRGPPIA